MNSDDNATLIRQADFERDGFVVIPNFLGPAQLAALNSALDAHYKALAAPHQSARAGAPADDFAQFECDVVSWDPCATGIKPFIELRDNEQLARLTAACIGPAFTGADSLVMFASAGGKGQAWHQDCAPQPGSAGFNLNRLFYTRDVAPADGAIVVVPGSHRQGRIPPGGNQEPIAGEVAFTPRAGTLILLSGRVFHRVTPNLSGRPRISVNFRAYPAGTSADICSIGIYRNGAYDFAHGRTVNENSDSIP